MVAAAASSRAERPATKAIIETSPNMVAEALNVDRAPRVLKIGVAPFGDGFTLLPERVQGPLTLRQERGLQAIGFRRRP